MTAGPKDVAASLVRARNQRSAEDIAELLEPSARYWDPLRRAVLGREGIVSYFQDAFDAGWNEHLEIETLIADERHAVMETRSCVLRPGAPVEFLATEVVEVQDGRVLLWKAYFDPVGHPSEPQ